MTDKTDKSLFLKDCITDAFFELLKKKSITKITVDEIVKRAGVGRMTYFRNFGNKLEIIFYKLKSLSKDYYANLPKQPKTEIEKAEHFIKWIYSVKDTIALICKQNILLLLLYFRSEMIPDSMAPQDDEYKISFFCNGVIGVIGTWYENGFSKSPEEIMALVKKWIII